MRKVGVLEKMLLSSSTKRNLVSGFGLGIGASLVVFTLVLFQFSFRTSFLNPMFQGFNGAMNAKSSLGAWPFRFSNTISSCSSSAAAPSPSPSAIEFEGSEKTHEGNGTKISSFDSSTGATLVAEETHEGDSLKKAKNESFFSEQRGFNGGKEHQGNLTGKLKNGSWKCEETAVSVKTHELNESFSGKLEGSTERMTDMKNGNVSRSSGDEKVPLPEKDKVAGSSSGLAETKRLGDQSEKCDIFDGGWVRDNRKPHYPTLSCPHIDRDFNCYYNGRRDVEFLKWRWQPSNCNIPRLNASDFLERMRGKRLLFVGDSLNRNMWESLVCILRQAILNKRRVHEISGRREFKRRGSYSFMYKDYNCSIDFISAPFMVKPSSHKVRNRSIETLRLDLMDQTSPLYRDSDVIVFNSGHWWTHEKTSKGENYYQEGNYVYPKLEAIKAYEKALTTWARWVDKNIDPNRTLVFFRGYSLTHFRGGQWNSGGQCHKETEPILNESYLEKYPSKMIVLENVIRKMKTPVVYLNISKLTDYRKDGHPSIYRKRYKTVQEQFEAEKTQDCSHWCLPGIPDTWNELLYASLLQTGIGSWRS